MAGEIGGGVMGAVIKADKRKLVQVTYQPQINLNDMYLPDASLYKTPRHQRKTLHRRDHYAAKSA